jgi:hypothetical protein
VSNSNDTSKGSGRSRRRGGRNRPAGRSAASGAGGGAKARPEIPEDFWGDVASIPDTAGTVHITHAPAAVVQSLGRVPLPGHEVPAEHTFKLVYDYAVNLASTLAVAGELIDPEELQGSNGG